MSDGAPESARTTAAESAPLRKDAAPSAAVSWLLQRGVVIVCIAVLVVSALLVLCFEHGRDQSIYALVAREMLNGGMPYRDAFDFKPPGIFFVYAAVRAVFGENMMGIRIVEVASMGVEVWCLHRLCRTFSIDARVAWIAAALSAQLHAQLDFWHTAQPESFAAALTLLGFVAWAAARDADDARVWKTIARWILVGLAFGAAGLMKPPLAAGGAVLAALASLASYRAKPSARSTLPLVGTAIGGVVPLVLVLLVFLARGALHDLYEVLLVFTPNYTKLSWEGQSFFNMSYYGFVEWLTTYSSTFLLGYVMLVAFRVEKNETPLVVALLLVIGTHIGGVVMQGKFFPYHWGATFPISSILAALGLWKALVALSRRGPLVTGIGIAAFVPIAMLKAPVPSFGPSFLVRSVARVDLVLNHRGDRAAWDALASVADVDAGQNRAVAEALKQRVAPGEPIFVWGFECAIYDLAERPLASRYIYNVPQRASWSKEPMQAALMRDLVARPPAAIVLEHNDVFRMVTGNNDDSARSLLGFPALHELVTRGYTLDQEIGDFDVYLRDPPDTANGSTDSGPR